jgi:1-aminocyclopropane-1-carboxylate deaminase/D-cysteine desulfhydrase-like pyridoxal-dependent ACC family enzyme
MTTSSGMKIDSAMSPGNGRVPYRLPLFARFPELEETLPRFPLGEFPTPVERLSHLGHDNLWIKRDDLTSPVYGGNKVRKLEFTLADALRRGCRQVITMGGIGTNHGLATAIFCREAGLACKLLLFHQPVNHHVKQNMLLFCAHGAELRYLKGVLRTGASLLITQRLLNPGAYILEAGGSSPVGTVGLVNAMFELAEQIEAGVMPEPRYIFCPLGTSGTMAGLALGALLAGLSSTVMGVRVTMASVGPVDIATSKTVENLMRKTWRLLKKRSPAIPDVSISPQHVIDDYVGQGYGCATRECRAALDLVREKENITLDPTYTAKAFAALLDYIEKPPFKNAPILYWHTYNSADLTARLQTADCRMLPPELRRIYEGGEKGSIP